MNLRGGSSALAADPARDDRVLPATRFLAAAVILVLLVAVAALYLSLESTEQNFAWTIAPRLTAMAMGAGYLMGGYFFLRVLLARRWHQVARGFLAITAFTIGMALATVLHVDRFHQGDWHFFAWAAIYAITSFLVPGIWWLNQRHAPERPDGGDYQVPSSMRAAAGAVGATALFAGLVTFVQPDVAIGLWPWKLTPLTARVIAGWLMLPAVGGLHLSRETRWTGWRVLFEAVTIGALFMLIAMLVSWSDVAPGNPLAWVFLVGLAAVLIAFPIATVTFNRKASARATAAGRSG